VWWQLLVVAVLYHKEYIHFYRQAFVNLCYVNFVFLLQGFFLLCWKFGT
jgi:hypothetical protein